MSRSDSRREDQQDRGRGKDSQRGREPETVRVPGRPRSRQERNDDYPGYHRDYQLVDQVRERAEKYGPDTNDPEERARNEVAQEESRQQAKAERAAGLEHEDGGRGEPGYYADPDLTARIAERKRQYPIGTANLDERVRNQIAREEARRIAREEAIRQEITVRYTSEREAGRGADRPETARTITKPPDAKEDHRRQERREGGHRDSYDPRLERITMEERKSRAVADLGYYRVASVRDISEAHFGGNPFTTRKAVADLVKRGHIQEHNAHGPSGKTFKVLAVTEAGAQASREYSGELGLDPGQRAWAGYVKPKEIRHDVAIYRAGRVEQRKLEDRGATVRRVRIDAELKADIARRTERARVREGKAGADRERMKAAEELHLPVEGDKVLYPDVQLEFMEEDGITRGHANIEVVTDQYSGAEIVAKASAGFKMHGSNEAGDKRIEKAVTSTLQGGGGSGGGGGGSRPKGIMEW